MCCAGAASTRCRSYPLLLFPGYKLRNEVEVNGINPQGVTDIRTEKLWKPLLSG